MDEKAGGDGVSSTNLSVSLATIFQVCALLPPFPLQPFDLLSNRFAHYRECERETKEIFERTCYDHIQQFCAGNLVDEIVRAKDTSYSVCSAVYKLNNAQLQQFIQKEPFAVMLDYGEKEFLLRLHMHLINFAMRAARGHPFPDPAVWRWLWEYDYHNYGMKAFTINDEGEGKQSVCQLLTRYQATLHALAQFAPSLVVPMLYEFLIPVPSPPRLCGSLTISD